MCVLSVCVLSVCVSVVIPGVGNGKVISPFARVLTLLFIPAAHRGEPPSFGSVAVPDQDGRERSFPFFVFLSLIHFITLLFIHLMSLLFKLTDHHPNILPLDCRA